MKMCKDEYMTIQMDKIVTECLCFLAKKKDKPPEFAPRDLCISHKHVIENKSHVIERGFEAASSECECASKV